MIKSDPILNIEPIDGCFADKLLLRSASIRMVQETG